MTTHLYRFYDTEDTLLYVGISKKVLSRLGQHLQGKPWANEMTRATFEVFDTRDEAMAAEEQAIKSEHPKYNIVHRAKRDPAQESGRYWADATDSERAEALRIAKLLGASLLDLPDNTERDNNIASRIVTWAALQDAQSSRLTYPFGNGADD